MCIFCDKGLCVGGGEDDQAWECDNCPYFHGDSTNWGFHQRCAERNDKEPKDYGEWPRGPWQPEWLCPKCKKRDEDGCAQRRKYFKSADFKKASDDNEETSTRKILFDSKVESEINKWSREEMVDLFLDGICESQDVKDFIMDKFPGEGECPINKAVFKLIMFKKLKGAPVTLMEKEIKDSL